MVNLKINGQSYSYDGDPSTPLLWVLRDEIGFTGTRYGCGIGVYGAGTVHLGGAAGRCAPAWSTRTGSCPTRTTATGTTMTGTATAGSTVTTTIKVRPVGAALPGTTSQGAGPSARPRTGQAATTRATTAPLAPGQTAAPPPARARAAGRSRRSPGDGPAERSGTW